MVEISIRCVFCVDRSIQKVSGDLLRRTFINGDEQAITVGGK